MKVYLYNTFILSLTYAQLSEQEKKLQRQARFASANSSSTDNAKAEGNTLM